MAWLARIFGVVSTGFMSYLWYVVAAVVLSLSVAVGVQTYRLNTAQAAVATAKANVQVCNSNVVQLEAAIKRSNKNADEAKAKADALEKQASKKAKEIINKKFVPVLPGSDSMNVWLESN